MKSPDATPFITIMPHGFGTKGKVDGYWNDTGTLET